MEKQSSNRYLWVAGLAGASLMTGCGRPLKQWEKAPGTHGHINLDAVKAAFQKNSRVDEFEKRVNRIYEGDHLVLFGAEQVDKGFKILAKEDLDDDKKDGAKDDLLFTLSVEGKVATLKGAGVNRFYTASWVYTPPAERRTESHYRSHYHHGPHFHYWYWGRGWGHYYTPASRYSQMRRDRASYRNSTAFHSQVRSNVDYESRMGKQYGEGFRKSSTQESPTRKSYVSSTKRSGSVPSGGANGGTASGWNVRTKMGVASGFVAARAYSAVQSKNAAKAATRAKTVKAKSTSRSSSSSRSYGGYRGSSGFKV